MQCLSLQHIAPSLLSLSVSGFKYAANRTVTLAVRNEYVYLSISKLLLLLLYSRTSDLFNELSFKLISTGNSCDSLRAQSCCYKSNHIQTFDRILFRRSGATNHSGIKQSPGT